jgi:transcriptional regulator with XRE-family HTH domain
LWFGLPRRLKTAREAKQMTRQALGLAAGLSHPVIYPIERKERIPRIDTVEQLARALDVSPCWLAYGLESEPLSSDALRSEGAGLRLKSAREKAGMSKKALAMEAETTDTTVRLTEAGKTMPSVATAEQLAKALGISPCWLAYGEGPEVLPRPVRRR